MRNLVRGDETGRQIIVINVIIIVIIVSGTKTDIKLLGGDERDVKFY